MKPSMLRAQTLLVALLLSSGPALAAPAAVPSAQQSNELESILQRTAALKAAHHHPIVLFDLDDTLFATANREYQILKEWSLTAPGKPYRAKVAALSAADMGYGLDPTLKAIGVPQSGWSAVDGFWAKRFFTSEYLKYDRPNPGAVNYVRAIQQAGAQVIYLSGRPMVMRPGTEKALIASGFPWDPNGHATALIVKRVPRQNDVAFKADEAKKEAALGDVVASFDNEPANVNMFHKVLPKATVVYLATVHSEHAPPVDKGIIQVPAFGVPEKH